MKLQRVYSSADRAQPGSGEALGVLRNDAGTIYFTIFEDRPIPAGVYTCRLLDHPKHGECWEVCDVPGRTGILFHVGNDADDSDGCLLVGFGFGEGIRSIIGSADGYKRFRRYMALSKKFTLTIADPAV